MRLNPWAEAAELRAQLTRSLDVIADWERLAGHAASQLTRANTIINALCAKYGINPDHIQVDDAGTVRFIAPVSDP